MRVKRKFAEKICSETPPQYHNLRRIVAMVREGMGGERLTNGSDSRRELEVNPRTLARDLDLLRDAERAPDRLRACAARLPPSTSSTTCRR